MKILHLNDFFYAGQTNQVFSLVKEQQSKGHLAHLAIKGLPPQTADNYQKKIQQLGAVIIEPGDENTIGNLASRYRYDLIHAHSSLSFATALDISRNYKMPFVATCYGLGLNKEEFRPYLREAQALFCASLRVAGGLKEYAHKTHIIPNGVDLAEYKPMTKCDPVKIAYAARADYWKQKSYHQLCKAINLLEGITFYITAGKLPKSAPAKSLAWTDNLPCLLAKTDIVVGSGRPIVEGLAAGNAVLILGRTYQGLLGPEKAERQKHWDFSGLSGSDPCYKTIFFDLAKLTQNPIYLQRLQEFGRDLAEQHFDNRILAEQIVNIYRKVLKNSWRDNFR